MPAITNNATAAIGTTTAIAILPPSPREPDEDLPVVMRLPAASVEVAGSDADGVLVVNWVEVTVTNSVPPSEFVLTCVVVITKLLGVGVGVVVELLGVVVVVDEGDVSAVVVVELVGVEDGVSEGVVVEVGGVLVLVGVSDVVGGVVEGVEVVSIEVVLEVVVGAGVVGESVDGLLGVDTVVVSDGLDGLEEVVSGTEVSALVELEEDMVNCLATTNPEEGLRTAMLASSILRQ